MTPVAFQVLSHRFSVQVDDQRVLDHLEYLLALPEQSIAPTESTGWAVTGHGPYVLAENGDHLADVETPDDVLFVIYQRAHGRVHERLALAGWRALHAATIDVGGRRVALVGTKGAGKSTLAATALLAGLPVGGDEVLFTRGGESIPHPRPFHLKTGTLDLLAGLPDRSTLPRTGAGPGAVYAFEPSRHGWARTVEVAPIDVIVLVRPERAPTVRIVPIGSGAALPRLLAEFFTRPEDSLARIRHATALLSDADVIDLTPGDPATTVSALCDHLASA